MKRNQNILSVVLLSLLTALGIAFSFFSFPIATGLNITLTGVFVAITATLFGPSIGAYVGFIWGTFSLIQGVTGMDPSGPVLFATNPFGLVFTCYFPRILDGFLVGLISKFIKKWEKGNKVVTGIVSSILVVVLNTFVFLSCYIGFFYPSLKDAILNATGAQTVTLGAILTFLLISAGLNFILELAINLVIDTPAIIALDKILEKNNLKISFTFKSKCKNLTKESK